MVTLSTMKKWKAEKQAAATAQATDGADATAVAQDAGTSAGVKKAWLKRERARQDAQVDTLDKGSNGGKLNPNESFADLNDRLEKTLKKYPWVKACYCNTSPKFRRSDETAVCFSIDTDSRDLEKNKKHMKEIKKALEQFMPKSLIESGLFNSGVPAVYGAGKTADRIVVHATNPSLMQEKADRDKGIADKVNAMVKPWDDAYKAGDKHFKLVQNPNDSLNPLLEVVDGAPSDSDEDTAAMLHFCDMKKRELQWKQMAGASQRMASFVADAFAGKKVNRMPVQEVSDHTYV